MKKKWKIIFGIVIFLIAVVIATTQLFTSIEVDAIKTKSEDIKSSFSEDGIIKPEIERDIFSMYTGKVNKIEVEEGDQINEGDLIIALEDKEIEYSLKEIESQMKALKGEEKQLLEKPSEAEIKSMEISIKKAEQGLEAAERYYERMSILYEEGAVPKSEFEKAEDLMKEAEYQLEIQKNALEALLAPPAGSKKIVDAKREALIAQRDLLNYQKDHYKLTSPISGIIAAVHTKEGEMVGPEKPLVKIFQKDNYKVESKVLVRDIYNLNTGMPVELTLELREEDITFPGTISKISPIAQESISPLGLEEERVKVVVIPDVPDDIMMVPGNKLDVEFIIKKQTKEIVVPKTALFTFEDEDAVLTVENNRAVIRPVSTGFETRTEIVITHGLEEGEVVIKDPNRANIEEGSRVKPRIVN